MLERAVLVVALLLLALAAPQAALGARPQGGRRAPATNGIPMLSPLATRQLLQADNLSSGDPTCVAEREAGMKNVESLSGLCTCQEGWIGPACDVCVTDKACGANQLCLDSPAFGRTDFKTFFCQIDRTSPLKTFLGSGDVWGQCDVASKTCTVGFAGASVTQPRAECRASDCSFQTLEGSPSSVSSNVTCKTTLCAPVGGDDWPGTLPKFLTDALETSNDTSSPPRSFSILCSGREKDSDNNDGRLSLAGCTARFAEVPLPVKLSCSFGDCQNITQPSSLKPPGPGFRDVDSSGNSIGSGNAAMGGGAGVASPVSRGGTQTSTKPPPDTTSENTAEADQSTQQEQQQQPNEQGGQESPTSTDTPSSTASSSAEGSCPDIKEMGMEHMNEQCDACADQWIGPQCNVCRSDDACKANEPGTNTCLMTPAVTDAVEFKTYSCALDKGSAIIGFLGVPDFWGRCDVKKKECTVMFAGANVTVPHVVCTASRCGIASKAIDEEKSGNSSAAYQTDIQCADASCAPSEKFGWPTAIPDLIRKPLGSQNTSIDISCKGGAEDTECKVNVALIPIPISIQCSFGDCYQQGGASGAASEGGDLVQDSTVKEDGESNKYHPLPIEMIFLPIAILVLLIAVAAIGLYIQSKKQYYRKMFAREMAKLSGGVKRNGLKDSDMSPALGSSKVFYPEYARSDKYSEINMNIMSELSFANIFYDVVAPQEDETWLEEGSLMVRVSKMNQSLRQSVGQSVQNVRSFLNKKKSHSEVLSTPDSKSIDGIGATVRFGSDKDIRESASMPAMPFPGDDDESPEPESPDKLTPEDIDQIYTPSPSPCIVSPESQRTPLSSKQMLEGISRTKSNDSIDRGGEMTGVMSHFQGTIQRTASRVREAVSSINSQFRRTKKRILHGVNGSIHRGNMLAIMGPSGGGKSTLLNILAGENLYGAKLRGNVLIDGKKRQKWYRHIMVYIPQQDELIPILTVKESVLYSGRLRLPWYYSKGRRVHKMYDVLEELKIDHVADSQVGGACDIRGISGGERRRVSIGMGLVADPKIMILDEPTSGLDAAAASSIMVTLKDLAQKGDGRIVIASLHQPSYQTFKELDLLLLLAKGRQIYFGPASGVRDKFESCGFVCPKGLNIADYILHIVSDLGCLRELLSIQKELDAIKMQEGDEDYDAVDDGGTFEKNSTAGAGFRAMNTYDPKKRESIDNLWKVEMYKPFSTELNVLINRSFKQIWRRPLLLRLQIALAIVAGLLSIAMFNNMERDIAGVQNRLGFFFFQLAFFGFAGISSIDLILEERSVFVREVQGKFYTPLAYYLSKVIVDGLMLRIVPMLIYDLLVYWTIGLREGAGHFFLYLISTLLFSLATGALCIAVTMGSKTGGVASLGIILLLLFSILFGGFLSNRGAIPPWIGWIQYLSIYYQVMGVLVSNEMRGTTFYTEISDGIQIEISADQVLDKIEFAIEPNLTSYVGALAGLYLGWIIVGYICMKVYLSDGNFWKKIFKKKKTD